LPRVPTKAHSLGGNGGGSLRDIQVAAGVGEHDRAGASPAARGMENMADCPAANTVSNRSTAAFSLTPGGMVTTTWRPSGSSR
jgi:hypothetical protein